MKGLNTREELKVKHQCECSLLTFTHDQLLHQSACKVSGPIKSRLKGAFSGKRLCQFSFLPLSDCGSTLKGKNLLLREQILPFKCRSAFVKTLSSRKSNEF